VQRAGRALTAATLVVAVSGYAVTVFAGHALDPADYERFTVYWGLFFACTGVLDGLLQETTRAVTARRRHRGTDMETGTHAHRARPLTVAAGVGLGTGGIVFASSPLWADRLLPDTGGVTLLSVGLACYAVQATVCGLLSASGRWRTYAWLISLDSAVRVLLAALAWAAGWRLTAFLLVTVIGAATWTGLAVTALRPAAGPVRGVLRAVADVPTGEFLRRCGAAMVASGANALLITGFPVLLTVTSTDAAPGALAAVITAVTLTRAPLLVPLQRFLPALIVHLTGHRDAPLPSVLRLLSGCVAASLAGGVLAWLFAVPVASLFFPAELVADAATFAVLTTASGALAILMVTGAAVLSAERHGVYVTGWIVATAVAVALLSTGADPAVRAALAVGVAPLVGAAVHLVAIRPSRASQPASRRAGSSSRTP
jgi:O-antigen/teichoic acid export membrane protein